MPVPPQCLCHPKPGHRKVEPLSRHRCNVQERVRCIYNNALSTAFIPDSAASQLHFELQPGQHCDNFSGTPLEQLNGHLILFSPSGTVPSKQQRVDAYNAESERLSRCNGGLGMGSAGNGARLVADAHENRRVVGGVA